MIRLIMDDRLVTAEDGDTLLDVAKANGIFVPALCYHKAVSPYGACRLCLVEVEKGDRKRVAASCSYLAEDDIRVDTQAPKAVQARNMAMELLLARCPNSLPLRALALKMGVQSSRFRKRDDECILCGLCVRVCREVIGANCISFVGRGAGRKVATPYGKPTQQCIGCGACVSVCPTGAIHQEHRGPATVLPEWETVLQRAKCPQCGQYFAPYRQIGQIQAKLHTHSDLLLMCPDCRRKRFSREAAALR